MSEETEVPAEETSAPETEAKKIRNLTPAEWEEVKTKAELGVAKIADLSREYGISTSAISQYFKRHNVTAGSRKHEVAKKVAAVVTESVVGAAVTFADKRMQRIEETKSQHYQWAQAIGASIMKEIVDAKSSGVAVSDREANIRTLNTAAKALATVREERYKLLDADQHINEDELPSIGFDDFSQEEIDELQNAPVEGEVDLPEIEDEDDVVVEGDVS